MRTLTALVRPNILGLTPYVSARTEYSGAGSIFLDANENPYGIYNRYPDPLQTALKQQLSVSVQVDVENIFIGNGSDEVIDLCFRIFCRPGIDKAITYTPTYGMYEVSAAINDIDLVKLPLDKAFNPVVDSIAPYAGDPNVKLLILCSPNNPTGNVLANVDALLATFTGIVLLDEAYIDFAGATSYAQQLSKYPNLIVAQTLSKAYGMAAARIGIAYASAQVIALFNKVKQPYNISKQNQQAALTALQRENAYKAQLQLLVTERERVRHILVSEQLAQQVYPSDANFLLVQFTDAQRVYNYLLGLGIITRNRTKDVANCIRITIGTPQENDKLLQALRDINITTA